MDEEIEYGALATFNCTAVGSSIQVSWEFNGNAFEPSELNINGNNSISNHTISSTLTINTTQHINLTEDVLMYSQTVRCIIYQNATGEFGLQEQDFQFNFPATLRVMARKPQINASDDIDGMTLGADLFISPFIDYGSPRANISWLRNGIKLNRNERVDILDNGSLVMRSVVASDRGVYTIEVSNFFGTVSDTVDVTVNCE